MPGISLYPRLNRRKRVRVYVLMGRGVNPEGVIMNIRAHVQASGPQSAFVEATNYYEKKGYHHIKFDITDPAEG